MRRHVRIQAGMGIACLSFALSVSLTGCKARADDESSPPPEVGVAKVISRKVQNWDEFNGRVSAVNSVNVKARVSGYLTRIAFREGSNVKRGDLLFEIDQRPYRAALDNAVALQERARAAVALAKTQLTRVEELIASNAASREEVDNRTADLARTNADLRAADAAVTTAKLNLEFTELRAPIDGRIGRALLTVGNLIQADQSDLTTIVSQDPVYVYFDCDEQSYLHYLASLRKSDTRENNVGNARVGLADEESFPHAGTVDFLDNHVASDTGTIRARVTLRNESGVFTPGLYARVQFSEGEPFNALLIDNKAILTDQDRKYVYIIGPGNKAIRKDIVIGRNIDGLREIQSGLARTDKVVVTGMQKIFFPGMPVSPIDASASTTKAAGLATS